MKLLFTGAAPWCNTGYSKPLRELLPRLIRAGHECALAPFFGWHGTATDTDVGGETVRLYPPARDAWFNDIIENHATQFGADAVITLQDVWILDGWGKRGFTWCPWMPIDCWPPTQPVLQALEGCFQPLSFSKWGRDQLRKSGWQSTRYMPIGVDLEIHQPRDQAQARCEAGLPVDGLIIGMVAANSSFPSRKSVPEVLQAWKRWKDGGGEGVLYIHTTIRLKGTKGIDFGHLVETLGLSWATMDDPDEEKRAQVDVLFPSQYRMWVSGYNDRSLATIYQSLDVLFHPSMSEGFGIPIVEAQACGVPVVTLEFTSMPELTFGGICLEPRQLAWVQRGGWRGVVDVDDLLGAIDWATWLRDDEQERLELARKAWEGARPFEWGRVVAEHWLPFLEELESWL